MTPPGRKPSLNIVVQSQFIRAVVDKGNSSAVRFSMQFLNKEKDQKHSVIIYGLTKQNIEDIKKALTDEPKRFAKFI